MSKCQKQLSVRPFETLFPCYSEKVESQYEYNVLYSERIGGGGVLIGLHFKRYKDKRKILCVISSVTPYLRRVLYINTLLFTSLDSDIINDVNDIF